MIFCICLNQEIVHLLNSCLFNGENWVKGDLRLVFKRDVERRWPRDVLPVVANHLSRTPDIFQPIRAFVFESYNLCERRLVSFWLPKTPEIKSICSFILLLYVSILQNLQFSSLLFKFIALLWQFIKEAFLPDLLLQVPLCLSGQWLWWKITDVQLLRRSRFES